MAGVPHSVQIALNAGSPVVPRPSGGKSIRIDFEEYEEKRFELDVDLRAGDVIVVPRNGLAIFGYALAQISPFSSVVVQVDNNNNN